MYDYDNDLSDWVPDEAQALQDAADRLEEFDPDSRIEPRVAFLLAKWMRSYSHKVSRDARISRSVHADSDAVALARHITGKEG